MISMFKSSLIVGLSTLSLLCSFTPALPLESVESIEVPRAPIVGDPPVIQRFIMLSLVQIPVPDPVEAQGVLVLFAGGGGRLGIGDGQLSILQTNFLVRTRHHFAAQGFHVAVMDAASDFLSRPEGLGSDRTSPQHMQDIAVVVEYLRVRFPGLPIWLVGTSRGSISAANAAAVLRGSVAPDGIVLTSSLTQPGVINPESLQDVALGNINVPAFVGAHRYDACPFTPPEDAKELFQILKQGNRHSDLKFFKGGFAPLDEPCEALAAHGFFGIESQVVEAIGTFIRSLGAP